MSRKKRPVGGRNRRAEIQIGSRTDIVKIRKSAGSSNRLYRLEFDPLAPITRTGIHFLPALLAYRIGRLAAWLIYAHNEAALAGYRRGRLEVER